MADRITANLPARDFAATSAFYGTLGFLETFRDEGWMILRRGGLVVLTSHQPVALSEALPQQRLEL